MAILVAIKCNRLCVVCNRLCVVHELEDVNVYIVV